MRLRTDGDITPTLEDSLTADNLSDNRSDNSSDNLKPAHYKESDNPDNLLTSKLIGIENQLSAAVVKVDENAISFDAPPIKEPEPCIESTSQVVSEGCQQVVSEVVSQPDAAKAPIKAPQPAQREVAPATLTRQPQVFRVGDRTHYSGAKGAMAVTCCGKELEVLNTRVNDQGEQECEIKASGWCASYWVLSRSLKKVR